MDMVKKIWPTPFKIKEKDVASFVIQLVIFLVVCAVVGWVIGKLSGIFIIGIVFAILGFAVEIYGLVGVILCVLQFIGKLK